MLSKICFVLASQQSGSRNKTKTENFYYVIDFLCFLFRQWQRATATESGPRKPLFTKVEQLKPGTSGHTLTVKVLSSNVVLQKGRSISQHLRQIRLAECLLGDETGSIIFKARNDQVDLMKPGAIIILRNAKITCLRDP